MMKIYIKTLTDTGKNQQKSYYPHFDPENKVFYYAFPKLKIAEFLQ
jgi:hypothetical protein